MKPMLLRTRICRSRGTASLETHPLLAAPSEPQHAQLYRPVTEPSMLMESGKKMASPAQVVIDEPAVLAAVLFEATLGQLAAVGGGDLGQRCRQPKPHVAGAWLPRKVIFLLLLGVVAFEDGQCQLMDRGEERLALVPAREFEDEFPQVAFG
ncbi:uncharacterized protein PG998_013652 [Apiospora kogelbergensis]|uniref:uncharacterized protein n=1 Tax=Apiospora kogelbergensis TaxID=1337665 RepID=UPI00312E8B2A